VFIKEKREEEREIEIERLEIIELPPLFLLIMSTNSL
jgi:hypothetical protein